MKIVDADAFIADARMAGLDTAEKVLFALSHQPTIEPNLILPERMERGECYEVGETIVVLNHDDYYDLLCKPTVDKDYLVSLIQEAVYDGEACKRLLDLVEPKQGEWIDIMVGDMPAQACDQCGTFFPLAYTGGGHRFCPNCGARMFPTQMSER